MKFNKTNAAQIEVPSGKYEVIVFDDDIPGFGLRARAGGSRNWVFQYRQGGKQRRISFGSASTVSAQQARERAVQLHAQVKLGHDPAGQKIESRARVPAWVIHDLRRTASTRMHEVLGIAPHIVEAVLNHVSGHRAGVAGVYNRALYGAEKANALARYADHLASVIDGEPSKIIAMPTRGVGDEIRTAKIRAIRCRELRRHFRR